MEQKQVFRQMVEFNRMAFESSFNAVTTFQENMEKMANAVLVQNSWLPEEGRKAIEEWVKTYKKGREDFKKAVDESFDRMEAFFSGSEAKSEPYRR